jgi:hypothetical protein
MALQQPLHDRGTNIATVGSPESFFDFMQISPPRTANFACQWQGQD